VPHEWRPRRVFRLFAWYSDSAPNIGCHFQGTSHRPPDPGLKPWAILYSRFAAKSDKPLRDTGSQSPVRWNPARLGPRVCHCHYAIDPLLNR